MSYLRLYRRVKIAPGVTVNLSRSGLSTSFGPRGARYTIGPRGTRTTVGVPGTGLFYTSQRPRQGGVVHPASSVATLLAAFGVGVLRGLSTGGHRRR